MKLLGLNFVNTRPRFADKHETLSNSLIDLGAHVISLPLQEIVPIEPKIWQTITLKDYQALIFVSTPSAHYFCQNHPHPWPKHLQIMAIGQATAATLASFQHKNLNLADEATSESLLCHPLLKNPQIQNILIVKGSHGRERIEEGLRQMGKRVTTVDVYHSQDIPYSSQDLNFLWQHDKHLIILISSLKALKHLWSLIPKADQENFQSLSLLVFSERIATEARIFLKNPIFITKHDTIISSLIALHQGINDGHSHPF